MQLAHHWMIESFFVRLEAPLDIQTRTSVVYCLIIDTNCIRDCTHGQMTGVEWNKWVNDGAVKHSRSYHRVDRVWWFHIEWSLNFNMHVRMPLSHPQYPMYMYVLYMCHILAMNGYIAEFPQNSWNCFGQYLAIGHQFFQIIRHKNWTCALKSIINKIAFFFHE